MTNPPDYERSAPAPPASKLFRIIRLWCGISEPVSARQYAATGFFLIILKYIVEADLIRIYTGFFLSPLAFLNPVLDARNQLLRQAPEWLSWAFIVWTLPFLWIAISMSVRRVITAGLPPWLGLLVLVPVLNLLVMLALCFVPSIPKTALAESQPQQSDHSATINAPIAIGISVIVGGFVFIVSVYWLSTYGTSLFFGTPLLMGATASYLYGRSCSRSGPASMGIGLASVAFALLALLLFAFEGVVCLAMAAPLVLPLGAMGGLIGKAIAEATRRSNTQFVAALLTLPMLAWVESRVSKSPEYVILTSVDVAAPPEIVWKNIVDFPELTEPPDWYFNWGIACPQRARIVGQGVGATRYCEFTTGTFVEPITVWNPPVRLAFNVADQPDPLIELSPYRNVRPPHLSHSFRSTHGEFLLLELPDGQTRLEGRTWYRFDMSPASYWTLWSDFFIHRIHERVLQQIKRRSEADAD